MDKKQIQRLKNTFDRIVHVTEDGLEYWFARELQPMLGYSRWENFINAIEKAKTACRVSGIQTSECFRDVTKTSPMPNGGAKDIHDIKSPIVYSYNGSAAYMVVIGVGVNPGEVVIFAPIG